MLFNFYGINKHAQQLPGYISKISWKNEWQPGTTKEIELPGGVAVSRPAYVNWFTGTNNPVALTDPLDDSNNMAKLGALTTQNPKPCYQSFYIDVEAKQATPYQFALYIADPDSQNRKLLIDLFDYETKNILMLPVLVTDCEKGKYYIFNYHGSVRIRISHLRGGDAPISGIFFDKKDNR